MNPTAPRERLPLIAWVAEHPLAVLLILACLGTLIYSNTFSVPFLFDDLGMIRDNPRIKDWAAFRNYSETRY